MPRPRKYNNDAEKQKAYRDRAKRNELALLYDIGERVRRPVLRYPGSKFKIGGWIVDQFSAHQIYVEPFSGGAAVFFRKTPSSVEVLNDLNGDVINFFSVLRSRAEELIRSIQLTPYSRQEYKNSFEPSDEPIEKARRFYVRLWQGFGGSLFEDTSWRYQTNSKRGTSFVDVDWNETDHLWQAAKRLKMAQIENDDAFRVIQRFDTDGTLFYVDPPYLPATRSPRRAEAMYSHELDESAHIELAKVLTAVQGMVVLSGYPSDLYHDLYSGWRYLERSATTNGNSTRIEGLWLSPKLVDAHYPLFKSAGL